MIITLQSNNDGYFTIEVEKLVGMCIVSVWNVFFEQSKNTFNKCNGFIHHNWWLNKTKNYEKIFSKITWFGNCSNSCIFNIGYKVNSTKSILSIYMYAIWIKFRSYSHKIRNFECCSLDLNLLLLEPYIKSNSIKSRWNCYIIP